MSSSESDSPLPWFEDTLSVYSNDLMQKLFPPHCSKKWFVYLVGAFHMVGANFLSYGMFLPPSMLWLYLLYAVLNLVSYRFIFSNKCFMTLLTNYFGQVQTRPLQIRMRTALTGLFINVAIAIFGIIVPSLSLYAIVRSIFV